MKSAGFKEWAIVCEALGRGEQNVIVRKGGIAEGRDGFSFREREFFLFPTFFHEQLEQTRLDGATLPARGDDGEIEIGYFARVERTKLVKSWDEAEGLRPFHILRDEVIRQRFDYDESPGLHVAFVRVFRLEPKWTIADAKAYGGCRSWVALCEFPEGTKLEPVIDEAAHQARLRAFDSEDKPSTSPSG